MRTIALMLAAAVTTAGCTEDEGPVGVNEIGPTWVEVYNRTAADADLTGWSIEVAGTTHGLAGIVPAGAPLLVELTDFMPDERSLTVLDAEGDVVQVIDVPDLGTASYGRVPDGIANWQLLPTPSPGASNGR
jgi:hypothetical protein